METPPFDAKRKVLVLGGSGYLGQAVTSCLAAEGYEITAIDLSQPSEFVPSAKLIVVDLLTVSEREIAEHIRAHDTIVNLTGQVSDPMTSCFALNTRVLKMIVSIAAGCKKRLLQVSTLSVYGSASYVDELSPMNPETPYAACKAFADLSCEGALDQDRHVILRLSNLYGGNPSKGLFAYLKRAALTDRKLEFCYSGSLKRFFLHVQDAARIITLLVGDPKAAGILNVAPRRSYTLVEIIALVEQATGRSFSVNFATQRPPDNINRVDNTKLRSLLADFPFRDFETSIQSYFGRSLGTTRGFQELKEFTPQDLRNRPSGQPTT